MKDRTYSNGTISRRCFLKKSGYVTLGSCLLQNLTRAQGFEHLDYIKPFGPAAQYTPKVSAAFVRRKGDYGMRWPGQVYDGEAALKKYTLQILKAAENLKMQIDLRQTPIYSLEEADEWIMEKKDQKPDGLLVVTLDRQEHAWPTVNKAIDSKIPTIVFSPLGTSFTTNTSKPSQKEGVFICSTDDFNRALFGIKMIHAGAKLRETRFLVIKGNERKESKVNQIGTRLHYIPANDFINEYIGIKSDNSIKELSEDLINHATYMQGSTKQDVMNGVKSYFVAKNLLEREKCDAISMDCLGALGKTDISLPCIAWSKMNDNGIPAACEADIEACVTHAVVQYLFDRPGFQQDPVAETSQDCLIGSHCCCPTKLNGFANPPEPYDIVQHHGKRDATARTFWRIGQRITVVDTLLNDEPEKIQMIISAGRVVENKSVPPSGGCVVAPMVKLDNVSELLDYPGFHQIFFYGDHKKDLKSFCRLYGIEPLIV